MTRITGDDFMLIGLHKMAAERGDGLIPEMLDMLKQSGDALVSGGDLVQFPARQYAFGGPLRPASNEYTVIAFPVARRRWTRR